MRILIADDWPNVQNALRVRLEQEPGLEVVGEVTDAGELLVRVEDHCPDIVLLGWELPGLKGSDLPSALRLACPDLFIVALSGRADARQAALAAGADAFVSKIAPPERLLSVILNLGQMERRERHALHARLGRTWGEDRDRRTVSHVPNSSRRSTMVEVEKKQKDTLKYVAIIAAAVVLLGCVAAGLTVSLVLINEIPFQHILPR